MRTGFEKAKAAPKKGEKSKENVDDITKAYPSGLIPFTFLLIAWVIIWSVSIGITYTNPTSAGYKLQWFDSMLIASASTWLINILWLLNRTGEGKGMIQYFMLKFTRGVKWDKVAEKTVYHGVQNRAEDDVATATDFAEFRTIRKSFTTRWFNISLITQSSLLGVFLIVWLVCTYAI